MFPEFQVLLLSSPPWSQAALAGSRVSALLAVQLLHRLCASHRKRDMAIISKSAKASS